MNNHALDPVDHLERIVLSFAAVAPPCPSSDRGWSFAAGERERDEIGGHGRLLERRKWRQIARARSFRREPYRSTGGAACGGGNRLAAGPARSRAPASNVVRSSSDGGSLPTRKDK